MLQFNNLQQPGMAGRPESQAIIPYGAVLAGQERLAGAAPTLAFDLARVTGGGIEPAVASQAVSDFLPGFARQRETAGDWLNQLIALPDLSDVLWLDVRSLARAAYRTNGGDARQALNTTLNLLHL